MESDAPPANWQTARIRMPCCAGRRRSAIAIPDNKRAIAAIAPPPELGILSTPEAGPSAWSPTSAA